MGISTSRWSRRRIIVTILASIGILAMLGTTVAAMVAPFLQTNPSDVTPRTVATPTPTEAQLTIAPLDVRVVVSAFQAQPGQCDPPPPPRPRTEPQPACDVDRRAHYELEPVSLELGLTNAKALKLPTSEFFGVQMVMDSPSSAAFAQYTAARVGRQIAFVRGGVVLAAPAITQAIDGQSIQLSGDLTKSTADTIVRMLLDGS